MADEGLADDRAIPVKSHFEDASQQRAAEMAGMWLFLATELMLFGGLFAAFAHYRTKFPEGFALAAAHLDLPLATVNTAILLTSGLAVAKAEPAFRAGDRRLGCRLIALTMALGTLFLALKGYEYWTEYSHGLMPFAGLAFDWDGPHPAAAHLFFDFYYAMTALHALHMIVGIGLLGVMLYLARTADDGFWLSRRVQIAGLYWAFVDMVWVFVFASLYLLGGEA
ncbi:MAG: cytochrome c oxidase subunit 3 [Paracoccaceae bacterium]